ncbi:MAG: glycerol kinase GlpK [Limisphaera sp.]
MSCVLAIDQSTSATKALLYDTQGHCVDKAAREHRQYYPRPGWVEHDAEEIWQNVLAAVNELAARHPDKAGALACLSLTNQRETFVVWERRTGRPLHRAIVWQCRRGSRICEELEAAGWGPRVAERTGLRLDTYFSGPKLRWLVREDPSVRARLERGEALIGTMDAYLLYRLTGGRVFATDPTNASRTLLFDIGRLRWDEELCGCFEVPRQALPEVRDSSAEFGQTTCEGILPRPVPICGVMGDSQASLFAQRCYEPGMAKITFGTGSSVLWTLGPEPRRSRGGSVTTLAWVLSGRPTYCLEGIINFSAATVAWLRDQLGLIRDAREAETLAASVPDNGGVYLVPAFAGLSAPHWRPEARAALVGLTAHATRAHVVRAAEESIAYQLRDVLEMMREEAGMPLRCVRADGGPTRDRFLMQFTADVLETELEVFDVPDGSALGAALAGMLGMGLHPDLGALAALPRSGERYRPGMDPGTVQRLLSGWRAAVQRVL